ncbi:hypothetical protein [Modestobacter sp. SYSU DS0290]
MHRWPTTLLLGGALLVAGWVTPSPASACSCTTADTAEQFDRADAVFTGTLVSREVLRPGGSSGDPALHVFAVDTLHKGVASARQQVVSACSGASCGLELTGDGPFLIFATDPPDLPEGQLAADLCGGTAPLTPQLAAEARGIAAVADPPTPGPPVGAQAEEADGTKALALVAGAAGAAVLMGALVVVRDRRAARRATVLVLTRD